MMYFLDILMISDFKKLQIDRVKSTPVEVGRKNTEIAVFRKVLDKASRRVYYRSLYNLTYVYSYVWVS